MTKKIIGLWLKSGRVLDVGEECLRIENLDDGYKVIFHEGHMPEIASVERYGIVLFGDVELEMVEEIEVPNA